MNRIQNFSKPFAAIELRDRYKPSHSLSFNDREDIRRRLASDSDTEDLLPSVSKCCRKSTLSSRLQSGQNLQICFMNESVGDTTTHEIEGQCEEDSIDDIDHKSGKILDNSYINAIESNDPKKSPNNNSCLDITHSLNAINISQPIKRPKHLFTKLEFGSNGFNKFNLFSFIEKPSKKEQFSDYHSKLHTEARHALAQVKNIVKKQIEIEKNRVRIRSPIYDLLNIPNKYKLRKNKLSKPVLKGLNVSQLQLIVNDMLSQIESLNTELVQSLVRRDELYMEQDSVLVDIEDSTIFL